MDVRPEGVGDQTGIRKVHEQAFAPSRYEADLVDALRGSTAWVHELSLVAFAEEVGQQGGPRAPELVGHVLFSEITIQPPDVDSGVPALALGPIGVLSARQRHGIGTKLIRAGLERASRTAYPLIVVLGHAEYYPRFGFEPALPHGVHAPFEVQPDSWLIYRLPAYDGGGLGGARSEVHYPAEWDL